ncbi:MAG: DnaJ domain-containing protein [Acidobacteriota bacterium]|jgi:tetratricopeptide (TPR) repeat protein
MAKNYYDVLGVSRDASDREIRQRFKELARKSHPDRFEGEEKREAERTFQELTEAFNVLTHPERRRTHDAGLTQPGGRRAGGESAPGAGDSGDRARLVRAYLARGVQAYKEGQYGSAIESFDRATEVDPKNPQAWYNLALTCSRQNRLLRRAIDAIEQACELEPMKISYRKLAGKLCVQAGLGSRAEEHYRQALSWGGPDPEIERALEELRSGGGSGSKRKGLFGGMI